MSELELYEKLKNKLGESEARVLSIPTEGIIEKQIEEAPKEYVTREILRTELQAEFGRMKLEMIKPSISFAALAIGIILAGMFAMFKLFMP